LGKAAQAVVGSIFGMGDYSVKYNSLTAAGGPPQFSSNGNSRSTIVSHREFVRDIVGTTTYSSTVFSITPSNNTLFPWLSSLATNYEEYRIHGMIFEFKATSGTSVASTNTALGAVVMATQYNPNDAPFSTKIEMENYEFATSGAPFENFLHPVECMPALTVAPQLYVNQPVSASSVVDNRLTDFGNFTIATVGMQASNTIGELWVSYQIELLKPRLSTLQVGEGTVAIIATAGLPNGSTVNAFGTNTSIQKQLGLSSGAPGPFSSFVISPATAAIAGFNSATGTIQFPKSIFQNRLVQIVSQYSAPSGLNANQILTSTSQDVATLTNIDITGATFNVFTYYVQFPAATVASEPCFTLQMTSPGGNTGIQLLLGMSLLQ